MSIIKENKPSKKKKIIEKIYLIRSKEEYEFHSGTYKIKLWVDDYGNLCYDCGILSCNFLTSNELRLIADYLDKRNKKKLNKIGN